MDHHATTPVAPEVMQAMLPYFTTEFGNPASSTHAFGRLAAQEVERAREVVADALGSRPREVLFTSGATESNNLALRGVAEAAQERHGSAHLVTCAIEHKSILDTVADLQRRNVAVTILPTDREGLVDPEAVRQALQPDTCLVTIQMANSEIGTVQAMESIGRVCGEADVPLHTDAVQALGRIPVDVQALGVRLLSLSAHKIYGPKGVGALYCHRRVRLREQMTGGRQERARRSGTLNVPGIIGLARALQLAAENRGVEMTRQRALRDALWAGIQERIPDVVRNGDDGGLPNSLNVSFRHVEGEALLMAVKEFALSSGSACTSDQAHGSYVIRALGRSEEDAHSSIRFGLGRSNTQQHVERLVEDLTTAVERLRAISPVESPSAATVGTKQVRG
jgi:cysteine desulfurase